MIYLQFYNQWHPFACFSTQQVKRYYSKCLVTEKIRYYFLRFLLFINVHSK